jgi:hypothetical protein
MQMPGAHSGTHERAAIGTFTVRIAAMFPPRVVTATVTPIRFGIEDSVLSAVVGWDGIATLSSSIHSDVEPRTGQDANQWPRFLQLIQLVLAPKLMPEPESISSGRWSSIVLSAQELDGSLHHSVLVVVEKASANAMLIRSNPTRTCAEIRVPSPVLVLDAGGALTQVASQLLLRCPL